MAELVIDEKPLSQWLAEFKERINQVIKANRLDEQLIENRHDNDSHPDQIWRMWTETASIPGYEGTGFMIRSKTENTKPFGITISAPLEEWIEEPKAFAIDSLLDGIGRGVGLRENSTLLYSLGKDASTFASDRPRLTKEDIEKATQEIGTKGHYADIVVIHPMQYVELSRNNEIIDRYRLGSYADQMGPNFCGIIDGVKAYETASIEENAALIYEKQESCLKRTSLDVTFDNPRAPKNLIVRERCIAWLFDKDSGVKVTFNLAKT
jgi:hypothetical protein